MIECIYKGQTKMDIRLFCGNKITGATETYIKYRKPSGKTGQWRATIADPDKGILSFKVNNPETFNEVGSWTIWTYITFSDSRSAFWGSGIGLRERRRNISPSVL